ncbi:MAG: amino acid adenylation domain-containing protein [Candidatus Aminicenantes bacterium]|nr:amino acid adenylation domain-containing protein [Candidatus Aminicenantes bacterium]
MEARHYSHKVAVAAHQNVKEKAFWLEQLAGEPEKSCFPYEHNLVKADEPVGQKPALESFHLPAELVLKLEKISGGIDIKLHIVLTAGLVLLLHKYTGNSDILTGAPVLKQEQEAEFINRILVFRSRIEKNMSFKELLLQVRETIVNVSENQNFPLAVLPDLLKIPVGENGFPLFDVVLLLENIHDKNYLDGIAYNILFSFLRSAGFIAGTLEYNTRFYEKENIQGIIKHFGILLGKALDNMDIPLATVDMLSEEERTKILVNFNLTDMEYPEEKKIHELFAEQVDRTPDCVALISRGSRDEASLITCSFTYRELNGAANRLAGMLIEKGVSPDSIVAILVEPSLEMMIGIWSVLKAGGAYLPIDPGSPPGRVRFMLSDSGEKILLTDRRSFEAAGIAGSWQGEILFLEEIDSREGVRPAMASLDHPPLCSSAGDLAYVIYTSGTTGFPKGVLVEHRNVVAYLFAFDHEFAFAEKDTVLQQSTFAFDVFVEEVFPVLLRGGKVAITSRAEVLNIDMLSGFIVKHKVNVVDCTPLLLLELDRIGNLGCVETVISGGDVLKGEYIEHFLQSGTVYNTYGPTETTVCASYYRCTPPLGKNVPIGKPIANYKIFILDRDGLPQPTGIGGELCISGAGVTRGYLNQPELTSERFLPNPFLPGQRIYRTGDLARWLPDGNIEFLGRIDDQVKVRGYRIELGEIESCLLRHPDIDEAVVIEKREESGDKYLVGYFSASIPLKIADLRDYLGEKLPGYMVPWFYVQVAKLPVTRSGKIDRRALPELQASADRVYVAPRDEIEEDLVGIWNRVLAVDKGEIGIDDNFFDLGGNSLKAIIIASRIHKQFDVKIQLVDIFKIQTLRRIAEHIKGSERETFTAIPVAPEKKYYPLSSAQRRLYIVEQLSVDGTGYNIPLRVILEGELNLEKLQDSFREIIRRHESLRTSFEDVDGEPMQKIHKLVDFSIEYVDMTRAAKNEAEATARQEQWIRNFVRPFDLSKAPLLRAALLGTGETETILLVDTHHIITDGISMSLFVKEIMALYGGKGLAEPRMQYKDYSEWQNRRKEEGVLKKQEHFWLDQFNIGIPVLDLPTDFKRPAVKGFAGNVREFSIKDRDSRALIALALKEEVTLFTMLLALFYVLLSSVSGQEDIVVGTSTAGRSHADLEQVLGMFVNTLPLRNFPRGEKTFREFLHQVKWRTLESFENQDYQFEELVDKVVEKTDPARNPIFDVLFMFQNISVIYADIPAVEIPGLKIKSYPGESLVSKFDITLWGAEKENILYFNFEYSTTLFKEETIDMFIDNFKGILSSILENPDRRLNTIAARTGSTPNEELSRFTDDLENEC